MQKTNRINLRLAVFIAVSVVLGILTAYFFKFESTVLGIISAVVFVAFLTAFFFLFFDKQKIKNNCIFLLIFAMFFSIGFGAFSFQTTTYENADLYNHYFIVEGKIQKAEETENGTAVLLTNVNVDGVVKGEISYKIMLYVYGRNTLDIGDVITFSATLNDKTLTYENTFSPYDLANDIKYTAQAYASDVNVIGKDLNLFEKCNLFFRETLKRGLDKNEFAVAYAMLTGDAELMDANVITAYRYLGVAHVFAVSGLHIGFLAMMLNFLFTKLKAKGLVKAVIITAILFFYSGMCGFTASSLRATIMSAVMLFLSAKGERYDGLSAVSIASIILLIISPAQLFCVGFQLSFTVVIGILLLAKPIERVLVKKAKFLPKKVSSSIGVVLSAQLASIPISLINFGYFSPISIIANFILIPIIAIIFYLLFVLTILGGVLTIPHVALFIPNYVLKFINIVLTAIDSEKLLISGISIGSFALIYYVAMIIPSGIIRLKMKTKIISTLVAVLIFIGGTTAINVVDINKTNLFVCGSNTASVTVVTTKNENVLVISDVESNFSLGNLRRLGYKNGIFDIDAVIIGGGFNYDMQVCVSKLSQVFNVKSVYYYGKKDQVLELIMFNSFPSISVKAFKENEYFPLTTISATYSEDGLAVDMQVKGKRIVALSTPDKDEGYDWLGGDIDVLITGLSVEQLDYQFKPGKTISYRAFFGYDDGESNGNFSYSFG